MSANPIVLDKSTLAAITMDKSTLREITPTAPTTNPDLSSALESLSKMYTGQKQATPEKEAEFQEGKKAGTISGARDAATMAVAGPVLGKLAPELDYLASSPKLYAEYVTNVLQKIASHPGIQLAIKAGKVGGTLAGFYKLMTMGESH